MTRAPDRESLVAAYWHNYVTRYVNGEAADYDRWSRAWGEVASTTKRDFVG
jgi:hypothetical protein